MLVIEKVRGKKRSVLGEDLYPEGALLLGRERKEARQGVQHFLE
jgi:hypothetical protein